MNFPAAGYYPFELDYTECCQDPLTLVMGSDGIPILQGPSVTVTPTFTCVPGPYWCGGSGEDPYGANSLAAIAAIDSADVWAGGSHVDLTPGSGHTLLEHWDGQRWIIPRSPAPDIGPINALAAAPDATQVWAASDTSIIGWDGTTWSTPYPATPGVKALAARAADDVYAAGGTVVQRWAGSAWAQVTTAPAGASLNGVAVANDGTADRVLAVGSNGSQPFSMHKGPTSWSTPPVPTPTGLVVNSAVLASVDYLHEGTDGASAWAVGSYFDLYNQPHALTEYWDGSAWTLVPNPAASAYSSSKLTHVWIDASGDVWAAGWGATVSGGDAPPTGRSTIILRWADYEWIQDTTANLGNGSELLANTTTDPAVSLWAAGDYADPAVGQQTLAERIVPPTPVGVTRSYYEGQVDIATHTAQGCSAAQTPINGVIVLDYGQPWYDAQLGYGTNLIPPNSTATPIYASVNEIQAAIGAFATGYNDCAYSYSGQRIIVVAGVNNSYSSYLSSEHGKKWAEMLTSLQATITPMAREVSLAGGIDAEPGEDFDPTYTPTANWVSGFLAGGKSELYNFGSPDTYVCRPTPGPLTPTPVLTALPWDHCDAWNTEQYYGISWGLSPQRIYALPQVYTSLYSGWWYDIARSAVDLHGQKMAFAGPLGSRGTSLDYSDAWSVLWTALNGDTATSQYLLRSTLMTYDTDPPP